MDTENALKAIHDPTAQAFDAIPDAESYTGHAVPKTLTDVLADFPDFLEYVTDAFHQVGHKVSDALSNILKQIRDPFAKIGKPLFHLIPVFDKCKACHTDSSNCQHN